MKRVSGKHARNCYVTGGNNYTLAQNTYDFGYLWLVERHVLRAGCEPAGALLRARVDDAECNALAKTTTISYYTPGGISRGHIGHRRHDYCGQHFVHDQPLRRRKAIATQSYSQTLSRTTAGWG